MVVGDAFAWGHVPKTGGEATREMFDVFPELIRFADPRSSAEQHTTFRDREQMVKGKLLVLNIRRLPAWILSREQHKARWGLHPDYVPTPMDSPEQMAASSFPDFRLGGFLDGGRFEIDRWLRTESLPDDFLSFAADVTEVSEEQRRRVVALGPVNANEYDRAIQNWLTAEQIERLYANNPVWAAIEQRLYGGLLVEAGH